VRKNEYCVFRRSSTAHVLSVEPSSTTITSKRPGVVANAFAAWPDGRNGVTDVFFTKVKGTAGPGNKSADE